MDILTCEAQNLTAFAAVALDFVTIGTDREIIFVVVVVVSTKKIDITNKFIKTKMYRILKKKNTQKN